MSEEKLILSHSEATSLNECSRQHFYAYILNLRPKHLSKPLQFGISGHHMLEAFYTVIKEGGDFASACLTSFEKIDELLEDDAIDEENAPTLELHMQKYFYRYKDVMKEWEILEVEKKLIVELEDKPYNYGCKVDLIALFKKGNHKGQIGIVDHKFLFNYYTTSDVLMHVQLPRYKWAAEQNGYKIDFGMLAQIRYRTFKDYRTADLFKHELMPFTETRQHNAVQEMFKSLDEAWGRRQLTKQDASENTKRALSKLICKYCDYRIPCNTGLNGESERLYLISDFKQSDYGYNIDALDTRA